jgi:hypothetical protein
MGIHGKGVGFFAGTPVRQGCLEHLVITRQVVGNSVPGKRHVITQTRQLMLVIIHYEKLELTEFIVKSGRNLGPDGIFLDVSGEALGLKGSDIFTQFWLVPVSYYPKRI